MNTHRSLTRRRLTALAVVFLLLLGVGTAAADSRGGGAGGLIIGNQTSEYPFLEDYRIQNNNLGLTYIGGFGYGVTGGGGISGGFGIGVFDPYDSDGGISAGFGGVIGGWRILRRPIYLTLTSWTGLGGVSLENAGRVSTADSYFAIFQELTLEAGLPFVEWFTPTVYAGYQVIGNVLPGVIFRDFLSYTPVIGLRIGWGSF